MVTETHCEGRHQQNDAAIEITIDFITVILFLLQSLGISSEEGSHWTPELSSVAFPTLQNTASFPTLHSPACKSHLAHSQVPASSAISAWHWNAVFPASPPILQLSSEQLWGELIPLGKKPLAYGLLALHAALHPMLLSSSFRFPSYHSFPFHSPAATLYSSFSF